MFDNRFKFPALPDGREDRPRGAVGARRVVAGRDAADPGRQDSCRCRRTASSAAPARSRSRPISTAICCPIPSRISLRPESRTTSRPSPASPATKARTICGPPATLEAYVAAAQKLYGDQADRFLDALSCQDRRRGEGDGPARRARGAGRDRHAQLGAEAQAQDRQGAVLHVHVFARASVRAPVWNSSTVRQQIGAYHTSDVPYWFGTQDAFNKFRSPRATGPSSTAICPNA